MANNENLVSLATRTQQEKTEIARKGAAASNKVQKEKRTFKKAIEWLANCDDIKVTKGTMYEVLKSNGIDVSQLDPTKLATIGLWWGAIQGNASNFKTLMEGNNEVSDDTGLSSPTIKIELVDNSNLEKTLYEANKHNKDDERQ